MKNKIFKLLICMMLIGTIFIIAPNTIYAEEENGFIYTVSGDPPVATITGYNGTDETITIPSMLGGIYPTVTIGDNAFYSDKGHLIKSVIIPDSVKTIGNYSFYDCSFLASMTIGNNVTVIDSFAFYFCVDLDTIIIPDNVTTIGEGAFEYCSNLKSVTIGSGVTKIELSAFSICSSLTTINVSVDNMNYASVDGVLYNKNITTLIQYPGGKAGTFIIPNTVTTIGKLAFYFSKLLTSVVIGSDVNTIEYYAFASCSVLESITMSDKVTYIGDSAFYYCSALESINIPDSVTTIGESAFYYCTSLKSITIPKNVTIIENNAFVHCSSLIAINVNKNNINYASVDGVLYNKDNTTLIKCPDRKAGAFTIPSSVTRIQFCAFYCCNYLTSMDIGSNVTNIEESAFNKCQSLTAIYVSGDNMNYASVDGVLYNKDNTTLIQCPGGKTGTFTIPNTVTTIEAASFSDCIHLISVTIGNKVKNIENSTFNNCTSLKTLIIGNNITNIWDYAFFRCINLTSVTIPNSVRTIGGSAFYYCTLLNLVTFGNSINSIGESAFYECTSLELIIFLGLHAPTNVGKDWIAFTPNTLTGHAYAASDFYDQGNIWNGLTMGDYIPAPPMFGKPSPMNGSTGNQLSLTWRIPINDTEGDQFSWTLECSNGQTSSSTENETNGTKSLSLSGLKNSKQYKVWVNATDPTGSGLYTREWYTFTTKGSSSSGDGNGNGNGGTPPTQNQKPAANLSTGEPYQGIVNTEMTFDGLLSRDPDGNITKWFWNFGDNTNTTGEIVTHTYSQAGTYTVTLTVTDNQGATDTDTTNCIIKQPNRAPITPTITGPTNGTKNTLYNYTALSNDADNDTIKYTFNWGDTNSQSSSFLPNATNYTTNHSWTKGGRYKVNITVTDNQIISSSEISVYIDAIQTGEIGYLLDNNTDGRYDAFYSEELQKTLAIQVKDGSYNIDNNGDKKWDYTYSAAKGLTVYKEPSPGFELIILLCAITVSILLMKKKKKL